jgi:hypothetical protein
LPGIVPPKRFYAPAIHDALKRIEAFRKAVLSGIASWMPGS